MPWVSERRIGERAAFSGFTKCSITFIY
jgi:hypothetical protein